MSSGLGGMFIPYPGMDSSLIQPLFAPMMGGHASPFGRRPLAYEVTKLERKIDTLMQQIKARDKTISELRG